MRGSALLGEGRSSQERVRASGRGSEFPGEGPQELPVMPHTYMLSLSAHCADREIMTFLYCFARHL